MKSKILALLCLVLVATAAFTACQPSGDDGGAHTHTFSNNWTSNETHHWHAATCEHGETKNAYGEHTDTNEDGVCDDCAYEVGHTHTFENVWQSDETHHWKNATCTHTSEKGEQALHSDEELDGVCDDCGGHVHTINTFGFCTGCDKETKPVDENTLGSVVYATSARRHHIVGGAIGYSFEGTNRTESQINTMLHDVKFSLGTNGTYLERTYANFDGKTEIQKDWIKKLANGGATGITTITVDGTVTAAQPSSFDADSLDGYYYAVSTLADGHGAENVLKALYEESQDSESVLNFNVNHDADANAYSFTFETLKVHETSVGQGDEEEMVYNVGYFVVEVSFTYNDDYALTSLEINCECYTNDPGADLSGMILEEDIDLDYNPVDGSFSLRSNAAPDTYVITVAQTIGTRAEIEISDGSEYAPSDFELSETEFDIGVGENVSVTITGTPAGKFMSFIKNDLKISVTDKDGNATKGLSANFHGDDIINIYPKAPGEYKITLTYKDIVKVVSITVTGIELGGENKFEFISTDNNAWNQIYEFKAEKTGTYVFYLPYGAAAATFTKVDSEGTPIFEETDVLFDYDNYAGENEGGISVEVPARQNQTIKFCFKFRDRDITYTFGYDEP